MITVHLPERVVSLLDPGLAFPELGAAYRDRHLRLQFHDAHEATGGLVVPTAEHMERLLAFLAEWTGAAPLLIHCRAGIGRSTATAFVAACLHHPSIDERIIATALRRIAPLSRPNEVLVALADSRMGRGGRMQAAIAETGRDLQWHGLDENVPFELTRAQFLERL